MPEFMPPLQDLRFIIDAVLDAPSQWAGLPAFADLDAETAAAVIEQAGAFAAGVIAPINASGDRQGCRWQDGEVRTPDGYPAAYQAFVDGGWPALACDPAVGGQGLPQLLNAALYEMLAAANHGRTMYPGLLHGAYECIKAHAEPSLRDRYLPKVASGEWLATMCLTEPQAGSDLGRSKTRGAVQADGSIAVTGSKCFISGGDQDMTPNIVHLVLCRIDDPQAGPAPAGSRGLSLVLCPKWRPDGSRNAIHCDGIEHKMGIHGSATCTMRFEGATGGRVGELHRGLPAMFVMMNAARLHVGLQGLGHLSSALVLAQAHAAGREQGGRAIAQHPAMRRILWRLRAQVDAARVLAMHTAMLLDTVEHHPDEAARQSAQAEAAVLTPVVKAFLTQLGFEGASAALQVFGGYGYVHETGIEQIVRDSRIAMIYEGTNEIQAIDLVSRKLLDPRSGALEALRRRLREEAGMARAAMSPADEFAPALEAQLTWLDRTVDALQDRAARDMASVLAVADDMLQAIGHLMFAWSWSRLARAASVPAQAGDERHRCRLEAARHGIRVLLPQAEIHWRRACDGAALPTQVVPA